LAEDADASPLSPSGLATDEDAKLAVDSVLELARGLAAASQHLPVLFAIDDYNALHWRTDYGATVYGGSGRKRYSHRRELRVEELTMASALRLLSPTNLSSGPGPEVAEASGVAAAVQTAGLTRPASLSKAPQVVAPVVGPLGRASVVAAVSYGRGVSPEAVVPVAPEVDVYHMPRYSFVETAHAMWYYMERGLLGAPPSEAQVRRVRALTNGHGGEVRRHALQVSLLDLASLG